MSYFNYCNEGTYTGLDTLVDTKGVYYVGIARDMYNKPLPVHKIDTLYLNVMFWNDGTAVYNFGGRPDTYQSYFDRIIANGEKDYFFKVQGWGNYRIVGDTIKLQVIYIAFNPNQSWNSIEVTYRIIDKNTLEYLPDEKYISKDVLLNLEERGSLLAFFAPLERIPSPNCKHKRKKWFWCTKQDWERYMAEIKKNL